MLGLSCDSAPMPAGVASQGRQPMPNRRKPHEERTAEDYRQAAEDSLELANVLAGQGGISDQDFL